MKDRCSKRTGDYWPLIQEIPFILIDSHPVNCIIHVWWGFLRVWIQWSEIDPLSLSFANCRDPFLPSMVGFLKVQMPLWYVLAISLGRITCEYCGGVSEQKLPAHWWKSCTPTNVCLVQDISSVSATVANVNFLLKQFSYDIMKLYQRWLKRKSCICQDKFQETLLKW